jgi:hypothetical protein
VTVAERPDAFPYATIDAVPQGKVCRASTSSLAQATNLAEDTTGFSLVEFQFLHYSKRSKIEPLVQKLRLHAAEESV